MDVSVGKTDLLYRAHPYHTKVPHLAIVPSILHYTKPGDVVLDGTADCGLQGVRSKQGSFKQVTSTAVKQDLVISAYKPSEAIDAVFRVTAGSEITAWKFVAAHLRHVPAFVSREGVAETIVERQRDLLYDRMVAFHVQRGVTVPLSAAEFYGGLPQRFAERDDMYFLPDQVATYDRKRMAAHDLHQPDLFVHNEETAICWLRQELCRKPRSFFDIHLHFILGVGRLGQERGNAGALRPLEGELLPLRRDRRSAQPDSQLPVVQLQGSTQPPEGQSSAPPKGEGTGGNVPDPRKAGDLERAARERHSPRIRRLP